MAPPPIPALVGLVLAGGASRRMGDDKGQITYRDDAEAERCYKLLMRHCAAAHVSVNLDQVSLEPYRRLPLIVDDGSAQGPAAGLMAAWAKFPEAAWLVLAVDLPLVDSALLAALIDRRNPTRSATAFVHPDGILEPLCAIWEPVMRAPLTTAAARGSVSLRRLLEAASSEHLEPPNPAMLASANTPAARQAALRALSAQRTRNGI